jgi:transcription elongation GreA/GreB family factor
MAIISLLSFVVFEDRERISKLEDVVANARVLDSSSIDTSKVSIMTKVKIKNEADKWW